MKLTKKLEAEILKAYHSYWDSYLKGDMKTFASLLDKDCHIIGSTAFDVFDNKKPAVEFYTATAEQISGKGEFKNRKIKVLTYGENVMVQELYDFYFLQEEEWSFYGHGRVSTLFSRKDGRWKIIHQHGSLPDSRTEEGEQIATEKISQENRELREAVKRRTVELEHKNYELEIESALEKVRSRTMAMQRSDELIETSSVLYEQLKQLNALPEGITIAVINEEERAFDLWITGVEGIPINQKFGASIQEPLMYKKAYSSWKQKQKNLIVELAGSDLIQFRKYLQQINFPVNDNVDIHKLVNTCAFFSKGYISIIALDFLPQETIRLLERFAGVFDLAYTRFLDLKQAEAQAREAKLEASLERVRSRTMAMQRSDELADVALLLFKQVKGLGITAWAAGFNIWQPDNSSYIDWITGPTGEFLEPYTVNSTSHPVFAAVGEARQRGDDFFVSVLEGKQIVEVYQLLSSFADKGQFQKIIDSGIQFPTRQFNHFVFGAQVSVLFITYEPCPEEWDIFKRFGKVFEQTYTRFLDLQKAEAQAREAQIEAALEKIRSRSLGMHRSVEIKGVVSILFKKLKELDLVFDGGAAIHLFTEGSRNAVIWVASPDLTEPSCVNLPHDENAFENNPIISDIWNAKETGKHIYNKFYSLEEKNIYFDYVFKHNDLITIPKPSREFILQADSYTASFIAEKNSLLGANSWTRQLFSDNDFEVLKRTARVFEQAYVRFLDLQKAEAQAREAQIEVSLERVRSKAMAMQKSEDLANAVAIVFEELDKLNLGMLKCGIGILNKEKRSADVWTTTKSDNNTVAQVSGGESMDIHPLLQGAFEAWVNQVDHSYVLKGEDLNNYYKALTGVNFKLPDSQSLVTGAEGIQQYYYNAVFSSGGLFAFRETEFPEEAKIILKRFADVFNLSYTRFNDLKQAEAQAKESKIEASLERVRSKAMSMRSSEDLAATIANFYHELESFKITPRRCGVGLLNKETRIAELSTMNTTEQGDAIEVIGTLKMEGHPVLEGVFKHWIQDKEYHPILRGAEIKEYYQLLRPQMAFPDYPNAVVQYGYFFFFPEGGVYAWTEKELVEDELKLYRRFTSVLSLTYRRYKDLKEAEALAHQAELDLINLKEEKKRTENALIELKAAQSQLIQAEKMASLGELTAGIAHEIQNPLNFVNNFSDVSNELLDEMLEEVDKGNYAEVKAIADDVKQNLQKINHHGKRADGIVKGMLQHSRSSSGQKEPTDINVLTDEYLRLAYHGLRAKDKTFNATVKTDYDKKIGNIDIIPQDIGRVILNLITNAFYAVAKKMESGIDKYEPTVSVSTVKGNDTIEIKVEDNGNGIPQQILDKIFQPFFTTKPTGQGTGLGLSLAYDIVKAYGGDLKVETKEGEGSAFIINIPISN